MAKTAKPVPDVDHYADGGVRYRGFQLDGEMHGEWEFFRKDGSVMRSGKFERGKQVGTWKTFDRKGKVVKETDFSRRVLRSAYDGGREEEELADPIEDLIGDYRAFTALQRDRLAALGIDIAPYELSHLAVRVPEWDQYVHLRTLLERHAVANRENFWNGRPISLILLAEPLRVLDGQVVPMIELIPPVHQRVYKMGMEHFGVVVGEEVDAFSLLHREALTGQQFQSAANEPYYVLFEDFTHVKFHRHSLRAAVELEGGRFDGFQHVDDWVPQQLVTATGPNPLPR